MGNASFSLSFFHLYRVDGGISNNDFVLELMSSLTCQTIDRPSQTDMSALGAAFLAGLAAGKFCYVKSYDVTRIAGSSKNFCARLAY